MEDSNSIHALAYFNLLKTGSWIELRIKAALKPFNLTHAQLNVLHLLMESDTVSAGDLKERMLVNNPDVTRLLDRLIKKGLVLRKTCVDNRRKIDISLTGKGKELFEKAHLAAKQSIGSYFEDKISEKEAKKLRKILRKMRG